MARRRRKGLAGLGYHSIQRFTITGCTPKRVYTSVVDVLLAAKHRSKRTSKTCKISHGLPGAETQIATCADRKCRTNSGKAISMRKLYEMEQGAKPEASGHGKRGKSVRNIRAKGARRVKGKRVF